LMNIPINDAIQSLLAIFSPSTIPNFPYAEAEKSRTGTHVRTTVEGKE
jgi:hypothetical protein